MSIEEKIASLLARGYSPQFIIKEHGFKKSTVYKVFHNMQPKTMKVTEPSWTIQNVYFGNQPYAVGENRFMPEEIVNMSFDLRNNASLDFYIYRVGIQPEWLRYRWHAREERFLLHPGETKRLSLSFPIPKDTTLGEYDLRFGVEGQFLSPGISFTSNVATTQWSDPLVLAIKRPRSGYRIFISHSTQDLYLVRQLQNYLDNQGIEAAVAEDSTEPGVRLTEKIERKIDECQLFLALLTANGLRSKWVVYETNYALKTKKQIIPLREDSVKLNLDVEWIEFSRTENIDSIAQKVIGAVNSILQGPSPPATPQSALVAGLIIGGLFAFLLGMIMGGGGRD